MIVVDELRKSMSKRLIRTLNSFCSKKIRNSPGIGAERTLEILEFQTTCMDPLLIAIKLYQFFSKALWF